MLRCLLGTLGWTFVAAELKVAALEKINIRVETELQVLVIHVQRCMDMGSVRLVVNLPVACILV